MKYVLRYLRRYTALSVIAPLLKLSEALLELFVPVVVAQLIDVGIGGGDGRYVASRCLILILFGVVGLAFSLTAQYFAAKAAVASVSDLKSDLFAHIQTFSHDVIDSLGTPTLITRLTGDADQVQAGVNLFLRLLLRSPFVVCGALIASIAVDPKSGAVFAVVIPVLAGVVCAITFSTLPLYRKVQQRLDALLAKTREDLAGVRVLRAFRREKSEIAEFAEANAALAHSQRFVGRISALMGPLTYAIIGGGLIALLYTGALRVDSGDLTNGQVVALYGYMSQILVELIKLANLIVSVTRAAASAGRIAAVFETKTDIEGEGEPAPAAEAPAVEFRGVSLRYGRNSAPSVEDITFTARRGETIGIIGGTGSGKSTILNMIPRFYDASEGTVLVDGVPVGDRSPESLRGEIGCVPQRVVLFGGTLRDNLRWGNEDASDEDLWAALEAAQAKGVAEEKGGLDFVVEPGGRNLSGGQRQRLSIARALVRKPRILLLDDASSALDFATEAALRSSLRSIGGDMTTFIVSQRVSSVMKADKIIVLRRGRIVGQGTHDELYASCSVYREICDSQLRKEAAV